LALLSVPGLGGRPRQVELGSLQTLPAAYSLAARFCLLAFGCIAFGLPVIGLLRQAFLNPYTGALAPQFAAAFASPLARSAVIHSLSLATIVALVLLAGAAALAPLGGALRLLRRTLDPNYLLPGTLLGLGLIFLLVRTPLYATPLMLFVAYALHFAPLALRGVEAGTGGIDPLVFAARVHGVSARRAWLRIGFPLLRPYLGAAAFMIFPLAFSELTLSALLYAPGSETFGVVVLSALNGGLYGQGAALGLVALAVALMALALPRRAIG